MRPTRHGRVAGLLLAVAVGLPSALAAQGDPPAEGPALEAVELFDPATGERTRRLVLPLTARELRAVERALERAGHGPGAADGTFTEETGRALRDFQEGEGLEPCGCVDWPTVRRLGLSTVTVATEIVGPGERGRRRAPDIELVYPSTPPAEEPAAPSREDAAAADSAAVPTLHGGRAWPFLHGGLLPVFPPPRHRPPAGTGPPGSAPGPFIRRVPLPPSVAVPRPVPSVRPGSPSGG